MAGTSDHESAPSLLTHGYSAPTVKQHLAAIRRLFDWLIVGQVVDQNAAAPVRGPTLS